tara:strand:- start:153 stop:722 length:570 start_codon:yes stop_codon:yes gene_type:complete
MSSNANPAAIRPLRYITGRGGDGSRGLSAYLATLASDYQCLAIDTAFLIQDLDTQLAQVREFSASSNGGSLMANSYGGYLLMLSLIDVTTVPERVLLLSPLLGRSVLPEKMASSRPPRERLLRAALEEGRVSRPHYLEIITGAADEICCPVLAQSVASQLVVDRFSLLENEEHMISAELVQAGVEAYLG